jgi:hypothetical protein
MPLKVVGCMSIQIHIYYQTHTSGFKQMVKKKKKKNKPKTKNQTQVGFVIVSSPLGIKPTF